MTATMALNAAGHRSDHGLASHLIQWWKEWRASVLGLLAGIAFAALVIMPLTFVLEDTVNGEFPIMSHDELGHEVARVIDLLKQPVRRDGMETYFETIGSCRWCSWTRDTHVTAWSETVVSWRTISSCSTIMRLVRQNRRSKWSGTMGGTQKRPLITGCILCL